MMNVCFECGEYRADKIINPCGPFAICPVCGYRHPFLQLPLLIVSGASGSGKSAVCHAVLGRLTEVVVLDSDILWRPEFDQPDNHFRSYFETWLRVCKNISQSGRPVVIFGAGMGVPENLEPCVERRYFSDLHYLALVCDDDVLADRVRNRPEWRNSHHPDYIGDHVRFNRWFKENRGRIEPLIELIDTTATSVEGTAAQVISWIRRKTWCPSAECRRGESLCRSPVS